MVYRGHVERGVVVLDDPVILPDGLEVRVEPSVAGQQEPALDENGETLGQKLLKHAGKAAGLPNDLAENHDHYLHGAPKRKAPRPVATSGAFGGHVAPKARAL